MSNFLAVLYDLSYFPQGVQDSSLSLAGVTGTGEASAQGIAHLYARAECGTWCKFVLDGAAYQPECPVHLLSLDALHFVHGEPTAHDVNFRMSRVTMADGMLIDLKRDKSLRLHFIEIMPYADFIKLNVPDDSVVEYCF